MLVYYGMLGWKIMIRFALISDIQLGFYDGITWDKEIRNLKTFFQMIERESPPDFIINCGDNTHDVPGGIYYNFQLHDVTTILLEINQKFPIYNVCGNHDIGVYLSEENLNIYQKSFGADFYSFLIEDVYFLIINSNYLYQSETYPQSYKQKSEYIRKEIHSIAASNAKYVLVFQHHPFCILDLEEPNNNFNIPILARKELFSFFRENNVDCIFSGHYHRYSSLNIDDVKQIISGPIGKPFPPTKEGYMMIEIDNSTLKFDYIPIQK